jgi:antitoxin component YwqK of YwqJK toxin-antitoxin module
MKSILFSAFFLFFPKLCISQVITANDDAVYLDSLFNMGNEKNYKYIRVVKDYRNQEKKSYEVSDFYKSGKIAMSGASSVGNGLIKTGMFVYFYENGNRKSISNYKLNKQYGVYSEFYENGNKKQEGEWIEDDKNVSGELKINQFWNTNNVQTVIDGNGDSEEIKEKYFASGKIKNGFKDGLWEGYDKENKQTYKEEYSNGKLVSGLSIDSSNTAHEYKEIFSKPTPKKGIEDFYRYIGKTFNTPRIQGLKGKIYITFVVDINGKIIEPKILRDIGYGTGAEAIRVLTSYGNWTPGQQRGVNVRVLYSIPITIQSLY